LFKPSGPRTGSTPSIIRTANRIRIMKIEIRIKQLNTFWLHYET